MSKVIKNYSQNRRNQNHTAQLIEYSDGTLNLYVIPSFGHTFTLPVIDLIKEFGSLEAYLATNKLKEIADRQKVGKYVI